MIELGKFTGEIDDHGYVGIIIDEDTQLFARPLMSFPNVSVINQRWLDHFGNKFQAVIDYELDTYENPILIGMLPLKDTDFPAETYEDNMFFYGVNFRVWFNEKNNEWTLDVINGGKILLGNNAVTEQAVLGNKLNTWCDNLIEAIKAITVISPVGPTSTPVNSAAFDTLKSQFNTNLSNTIKLK